MYDCVERYPVQANFTPPMQTSLLCLIVRSAYNADNNLATWSAICYAKLDFDIA